MGKTRFEEFEQHIRDAHPEYIGRTYVVRKKQDLHIVKLDYNITLQRRKNEYVEIQKKGYNLMRKRKR